MGIRLLGDISHIAFDQVTLGKVQKSSAGLGYGHAGIQPPAVGPQDIEKKEPPLIFSCEKLRGEGGFQWSENRIKEKRKYKLSPSFINTVSHSLAYKLWGPIKEMIELYIQPYMVKTFYRISKWNYSQSIVHQAF